MSISPVARLTFSMLSVTLSLLFIAASLGLVPNNEQVAMQMRATTAEHLALQVASLASHNEVDAIKTTFATVTGGETQIRSAALRKADGTIIAASPDHEKHWTQTEQSGDGSHVVIPLMNEGVAEASIEILFDPPSALFSYLGLSMPLVTMIGFIGAIAAFAIYFVLRRSLQELQPGSAFPERVMAAFNTLASGVLIVDEKRGILLANKVFEANLYSDDEPLRGRDVNALPWEMADDSRNREFPWETAARTRQPVLGTFMNLRKTTGAIAKLMVNATPIFNGDDIGGVMLTFDDVTMLQQKNEQLNSANAQLRQIKNQVTAQNEQLRILASTDGLTGCLNRRTFFVEAEKMVADARSRGYATAALMLDIDHFKRINDQYGHPAGDAVLAAVGQMMRNKFGNYGIVARYGGEEFAVMFAGLASNHIRELAEQLRNTVSAVDSWLPDQKRVTVSIGFAMLKEPALTVEDVVKIADEALYKAKHEGRNRVVEGKADLPLVA